MYTLMCIYISLYFLRPTEWIPGIIGMPLLMVVGVLSLLAIVAHANSGKYPDLLTGKIERTMLGFVLAIILSNLGHFYFSGVVSSIKDFFPIVTGFYLVMMTIDSRRKLQSFLILLIILSSFLGYEGCRQYITGSAHGGLNAIIENKTSIGEELISISRIRWYGVFNDPNDLGMALVLVVPFLFNRFLANQLVLPVICLPLISIAIYFTNSRGTILAGLASICAYFVIRYRNLKGLAIGGGLAIVLFLFGPSRLSSISGEEASAHGRIDAWYEAYQMFKDNPFFGVGYGRFTEFNSLTAHNSYVLVMAELGVFGLFFFTGLIYYPLHWLWQHVFAPDTSTLDASELGLVGAVYASFFGVLVAMFFLSRSYMLLPYILISLASVAARILSRENGISEININPPKHFRNLLILTLAQIVAINFVVKVFI